MKRLAFLGTALLCANLFLLPSSTANASAKGLVFTPESVGEFTAALRAGRRATLDREHADGARYHAYRFLDPEMVLIGVAERITVDSAGRVHVVQAPGQPMGGHLNPTHREYSHVLLPVEVSPP